VEIFLQWISYGNRTPDTHPDESKEAPLLAPFLLAFVQNYSMEPGFSCHRDMRWAHRFSDLWPEAKGPLKCTS